MEQNLKKQLLQSVNSIKNKLKHMRNVDDHTDLNLNRILKPITAPLKVLVDTSKPTCKEEKKNKEPNEEMSHGNLSKIMENEDLNEKKYDSHTGKFNNNNEDKIDSFEKNIYTDLDISLEKDDIIDIYDNMDIPFGIRKESDKNIMIGNSEVRFTKIENPLMGDKTIMLNIGGRSYELTPGLKELLLRKKPDLSLIQDKDKLVYKDILYNTNAHKRDYHAYGQIKGDKGVKYREIIKPLFFDSKISSKQGGTLSTLKKKFKPNTDLVYWDDPNELVDRLKLLIASKNAGNTSHDNEIISIIEELREAGIIKEQK
ncbi:uncharacterized protein [Maniola hyperantus]|uniref:uncharacterized protein n=1 Tax=Aphantopus hyperantus TaxID=2795564 RepID=UPI003747D885